MTNMQIRPVESVQIVSKAANSAGSDSRGTRPGVSVGTIEQFVQLLRSDESVVSGQPTPSASPPATAAPQTVGDTILRSLQATAGELRSSWSDTMNLSYPAEGPMSFSEALRLQYQLTSLTTQYDAVGKAVGKIASDVDQLAHTT